MDVRAYYWNYIATKHQKYHHPTKNKWNSRNLLKSGELREATRQKHGWALILDVIRSILLVARRRMAIQTSTVRGACLSLRLVDSAHPCPLATTLDTPPSWRRYSLMVVGAVCRRRVDYAVILFQSTSTLMRRCSFRVRVD